MGSYGIGMERIVACHIEQNHDANGIIWDKAIAPFQIHLIAVSKSEAVREVAEKVYTDLNDDGVEVLFDDRVDTSPGFKFKDADLLGMPYQVIVLPQSLRRFRRSLRDRCF
jgi:prolyl-tRNA synthetase